MNYHLKLTKIILMTINTEIFFSKSRLSSHCLNIEQGRHKKPKVPLENRICHNCSMSMIEDEIHFLLQCPQ